MTERKTEKKTCPTIIATHLNADFDAVASLLAAQKLYPDACVVFPGSQEKNLRNFFISSLIYLFNMVDLKDIDLNAVRRLVLVDTRRPNRIGLINELLTRSDLEIHVYDHHPPMKGDIVPDFNVHDETGATITIMTELLKEKGIDISPDEATVMCLGIYEDTGSFTFASTTERDFLAAAFLLSRGANLNTISDMIAREISPAQVGLLNDMIQASVRHQINGVEVVVLSVSTEAYVPDFAFLVHKMVRMENLNAIFAIARMANKIYVVARSRTTEVDVASILGPLGGGGHGFAASATIKEMTLIQVEQLLMESLFRLVKPNRRARDLMTTPPIAVAPDVSCGEAAKLLVRYNINALLVSEKTDAGDHLAGFITRQIIEKTLYHKLDHVPVREYMTTDMATSGPDADLPEIQSKIIDNKQRILPIMENGVILGVVTRSDVLNILVQHAKDKAERAPDPVLAPLNARTRNIVNFMEERLSPFVLETLRNIGRVADQTGVSAYVVGGFVRDLFLYRKNDDIDIVIEGDGIAFARKYAELNNARINTHAKFGTAVIILAKGFKIDVATARTEYYQFPAALPTVEMSSIKLDLFRRDFTINTLSINLNTDRFGTLIDFFSAQRDIKEKTIRILHNLSFVEDPTRVFRAIRFEQRFGFTIGKLTAGLIENAVRMNFFQKISGRRVFTELRLILEEENPVPAIVRMSGCDLIRVIHPFLTIDKGHVELLNNVKQVLDWFDLLYLDESYRRWLVFFMVLVHSFDEKTSRGICDHLEIAPRFQKIAIEERLRAEACQNWLEHRLPVKNSDLHQQLSVLKTEAILYIMARSRQDKVKKGISHYFSRLRTLKTELRGHDLIQMGVTPGPLFKSILEAVFHARLNDELKTRDEELNFARRMIAEHGGGTMEAG